MDNRKRLIEVIMDKRKNLRNVGNVIFPGNPINCQLTKTICGKNITRKCMPLVRKTKLGKKPPACEDNPNKNGRYRAILEIPNEIPKLIVSFNGILWPSRSMNNLTPKTIIKSPA
jgi:hypothetical protein